MLRSVYQAITFIRGYIRNRWTFEPGECQMRCHDAYNIPTDGTKTAYLAWQRSKHKFYDQWIPGAFAYWSSPDGYGHVAICAYRKGMIFSTDLPIAGQWGRVPLTEVAKAWPGHEFLGFSLDNDGMTPVRIPRIRKAYP